MHGSIIFSDTVTFVEWLTLWSGKSTAVFEAKQDGNGWVVKFSGAF